MNGRQLEAWAKDLDEEYVDMVRRAAVRRLRSESSRYDERYLDGYLTALARFAAEIRIRAAKEEAQ